MCRGITCVILTVINVVLLVAGLALVIAGALLKWNKQLLQSLLQKAMDKAGSKLDDNESKHLEDALSKLQEMSDPIGNVLFILGIVLCCIALLAFIGICCRIRLVLIIYAILVGIVFVAHLLLVIIYFAKREILTKYVEKGFNDLMANYDSIASQKVDSIALGVLMQSLQCCGYNSNKDFDQYRGKFNTTDTLDNHTVKDLQYPLPCCNLTSITPQSASQPETCPSYIETGCKERIYPIIDEIIKYSIIALAIEALVLVLVIINLSCSK